MVGVFAIYAIVALIANWPNWPGDPSRTRVSAYFIFAGQSDVDVQTWFLGWTAHALSHGLNPFFTSAFDYPSGVNLVQNTTMPLLGALVSPLTLLVNPVASMNLLVWLAFPLSALSAYFVLRRFVAWDVAAFVGGALYGFSPWVVIQNLYHLNLCFVPLPPLIFLAVYELFRREQSRPLRWGALLGVVIVGQFFISTEIMVMSVIIAGLGTLYMALLESRSVWPTLRRTYKALGLALGICLVTMAYPVYVLFFGPYRFSGSPNPGALGSDLLSAVVPTSHEIFSFGYLSGIGNNLAFGNGSENGGYLGIPLLLVAIYIVVKFWRTPWVKIAASLTLTSWVLSLGDNLVVHDHNTGIPLPFHLIGELPIMNSLLPIRFGVFVPFFLGVLLALALDETYQKRTRRGVDEIVAPSPSIPLSWSSAERITVCLLAFVTFFSVLPAFPLSTAPTNVPSYFTSTAVNAIPFNSVVQISPFPWSIDPVGQLWQAMAQYRFKIIGGYSVFAQGRAGTPPDRLPLVLDPTDVQSFLTGAASGETYPGPFPKDNLKLECDYRSFLLRYKVWAVLSGPIPPSAFGSNAPELRLFFERTLGSPSVVDGTVSAWYDVAHKVASTQSHFSCTSS
jgi:hypothetical protein